MEELLNDLNKNINELESKVESQVESLSYLLKIKEILNNMIPLAENSTVPDYKEIILKVLNLINHLIDKEGIISPKNFILLAKSQKLLRMLYNVDQSYELFDEELVKDWLKNYDVLFKKAEEEKISSQAKEKYILSNDKTPNASKDLDDRVIFDSLEVAITKKPISVDDIIEKELDVFPEEKESSEEKNLKNAIEKEEEEIITGSLPSNRMEIPENDEKIELKREKKIEEKTGFSTSDLIEDIGNELERESESKEEDITVAGQIAEVPFIKELSDDLEKSLKEYNQLEESNKDVVKEEVPLRTHKKSPTEPVLFAEAGPLSLDSSKLFDSPLIKLNKYAESLNYVSKGFDTILNKTFALSNTLKNYLSTLSSDKEISELKEYHNYIEQIKESYLNASDIQKQLLTYTTGFNENLTLLRAELNTILQKVSSVISSFANINKVQFFKCFDNIFAFPLETLKNTKTFLRTEILKNEKGKQIIYNNKTYEIYHIAKLLGFANTQVNLNSSNLIFLNIMDRNIAIEVDELLESKITFKASDPQLEKSIKGVIGIVFYSEEKSCLLFDPLKLLD